MSSGMSLPPGELAEVEVCSGLGSWHSTADQRVVAATVHLDVGLAIGPVQSWVESVLEERWDWWSR